MSFDPLSAAFELGKVAIEKIWPDPNKRAAEVLKLEELRQKGDLAELNAHVQLMLGQIEVNKVEAAHKSLLVAGARPFTLWVCGLALCYNTLLYPIIDIWLDMPIIDTSLLYPVLMGTLGLGGMRSWEKSKGVAREK